MKGQMPLNIKKIKEDRRFLLNRNLSEIIASHQDSMYNTTITFSLLALVISGFSIVYLSKTLWIIIVYCMVALFGILKNIRRPNQILRKKEI